MKCAQRWTISPHLVLSRSLSQSIESRITVITHNNALLLFCILYRHWGECVSCANTGQMKSRKRIDGVPTQMCWRPDLLQQFFFCFIGFIWLTNNDSLSIVNALLGLQPHIQISSSLAKKTMAGIRFQQRRVLLSSKHCVVACTHRTRSLSYVRIIRPQQKWKCDIDEHWTRETHAARHERKKDKNKWSLSKNEKE